jgi:hypothetical protein
MTAKRKVFMELNYLKRYIYSMKTKNFLKKVSQKPMGKEN